MCYCVDDGDGGFEIGCCSNILAGLIWLEIAIFLDFIQYRVVARYRAFVDFSNIPYIA